MRRFTIAFLSIFLIMVQMLLAQIPIDHFDTVDTTYSITNEGLPSSMTLSVNDTDYVEGTGALDAKVVIGSFHPWGSFNSLIFRVPESEPPMDWSDSDSLSLWIKVRKAPTHPEYMVFRIHLADQPNPTDDIEEYIYENAVILDSTSDWVQLKVPIFERPTDGSTVPNDEGFVLFPQTWGGGTYNNRKLDRDKIVGFNLAFVTTGWTAPANIPADSLEVSLDLFARFGARAFPFVIFNGKVVSQNLSAFVWGGSSITVEADAGATPGTNALKWVQGDEWGSGWTGFGFNINPTVNLLGSWMKDSVKFKMKTPSATGALRIQFESGADGKVGLVFTPTNDDQWHEYKFALRDMVYQDNTSNFDTTRVSVVGIMAEASGVVGNTIYIDDWWTDNPEIDVVAPQAPGNLLVIPGDKSNLVTWVDVPGESGETYNVYYSPEPITDLTGSKVEMVEIGQDIPENTGSVTHLLFAPAGDSSVTYYYAVTTVDAAGNESAPAVTNNPVTNTAKAMPVIYIGRPSNFNADGNLSEWTSITPFRMYPSEGAHIVVNTVVDNDDDLSVLAWVAIDAESLYVAFDVNDDVVDVSATNNWEQDSPDLFIGFYNHHGAPHRGYDRGSEPDYHFRFNKTQAIIDNLGGKIIATPDSARYVWKEKFPAGYTVEMAIALSDIASAGGDDLFVPVEGMRIPIDFAINDADGGGVRQGIVTLSPYNDDTSWQSPKYWLHTWYGARFYPLAISDEPKNIAFQFNLLQNYPNPFNPTTTIRYTLARRSSVVLDVFNTLGQKVRTLVNTVQAPGRYEVQLDALGLASGIYFYRLQAGNFVKIRKMLLMR